MTTTKPPSREELAACLEDVLFRTPSDAPGVEALDIEGVRGRATPIPTPFTNVVGVGGPGADVPDTSIDAVIATFRERGQPFGWLVGPHSPNDLRPRLEARGLAAAEEFAGLALTDLAHEVPAPDDVCVREVSGEEQPLFQNVLSRAFGLPPEMVTFLCDILYFAGSEIRARNYLAEVAGADGPVGAASTIHAADPRIAVLGGAAVFEAHRGRGAYRALLARRLADLRADGVQAAVIQAARNTSAPICCALGFTEVCAQTLYAWMPD